MVILKNILIVICIFLITFFSLNFTNTSLNIKDLKKEDLTESFFKYQLDSKFDYIDKGTLNIRFANEKNDIDYIKSTPHLFYKELTLNDDEEIYISFVVKNNIQEDLNDSEKRFLYVDLYGEDFDNDANQIFTEIPSKVKEVRRKLYVGKVHPNKVSLRFFTSNNIDISISNISIWKYKVSNRKIENLLFSLLVAIISFLILKFKNTKKFKVFYIASFAVILITLNIFLKYLNDSSRFIICDESVYIAQTLSYVFDNDNQYDEKDFVRFLLQVNKNGPSGIFLNYYHNKFYFSKTILFPLFGAPFAYFFGVNGLEVLNFFCFLGLIILSYVFLKKRNNKILSLFFAICYILCSVSVAYIFESFIDLFNIFSLSLVFLIFFKYIENPKDNKLYLNICALLFGILIYSRIPYFPFVFFCCLKLLFDKRAGFKSALIFVMIFLIPFSLLTLYHINQIGYFSPYGGIRYHYGDLSPYMNAYKEQLYTSKNLLEDKFLIHTNADNILESSIYALSDIKAFLYNIYCYLLGWQTGVLIYFPCVFLVFFNVRKKDLLQNWYIFCGILGHILFFMLQGFSNYFGGGHSLGNRYFLQILLMFLFLVPNISVKRTILGLCFTLTIFFTFLISPLNSALRETVNFRNRDVMQFLPRDYTQFIKMLDLEWFQRINFTKDGTFTILWKGPDNRYYDTENDESKWYWTRGTREQLLMIISKRPIANISFKMSSGLIDNQVILDNKEIIDLVKNNGPKIIKISPKLKHKFYDTYYYEFTLKPKYSFIPKEIFPESSNDQRNLGVSLSNFDLVYEE